MPDTVSRIAGPALITNAAATVYTVPASKTLIIRHLLVANTSGTAATFFLSIGTDAAGTRLYSGMSIAANTVLSLTGFIVVNAGEIIQSYSGTTNVLTLTISGVLID